MPTNSAAATASDGATSPSPPTRRTETMSFIDVREAVTPFACALDLLSAIQDLCRCTRSTFAAGAENSDGGGVTPAVMTSIFPDVRVPVAWTSAAMQSSILWLLGTLTAAARDGVAPTSQPRSVEWLLVHLTTEGPSLRAAVCDARVCPPVDAPTQDSSIAETRAGVQRDSVVVSKEALAFIIRCTASALLQVRSTTSDDHSPRHIGDIFGQSTSALSCLLTSSTPRPVANSTTTATTIVGSSTQPCSSRTYWCSTGCGELDHALSGNGLRSGWLTEVYGEAGAGKTQFALQCLLQQAAADASDAAVALVLAHHPDMPPLTRIAGVAGSVARQCAAVFSLASVQARRCAVVYLVSEDVPTSRLGPLAAGAVARAVRAVRLHPLLTQLSDGVVSAVLGAVERMCTVPTVLSRLQIRHVGSVAEVLRLLDGSAPAADCVGPAHGPGRGGTLAEAVRAQAGSQSRAVIVLDSVAAAVVAGQWTMHGAAQDDATVAAVGVRLHHVAVSRNWCVLVANQVRAAPTFVRQRHAAQAHVKRTRSPSSLSSALAAAASTVPALGMSWATAPHCRIALRKSLSHGVRQLVLCHAPAHPPAQASFVINDGGIEDA